jgi:hypothetical protein
MAEVKLKPFRPSNSDHGYGFMSHWCSNCHRHRGGRCGILFRAMAYNIDDPQYPSEWVETEDGDASCTAFHDKNEPLLRKKRGKGHQDMFPT